MFLWKSECNSPLKNNVKNEQFDVIFHSIEKMRSIYESLTAIFNI